MNTVNQKEIIAYLKYFGMFNDGWWSHECEGLGFRDCILKTDGLIVLIVSKFTKQIFYKIEKSLLIDGAKSLEFSINLCLVMLRKLAIAGEIVLRKQEYDKKFEVKTKTKTVKI